MKGVVDRIVGNIAVIEIEGSTKEVERSLISEDIKEGSVVQFNGQKWELLEEETKERTKRIQDKMKKLFE